MAKRAAGFLIFRSLESRVEYLLLKASYGSFHWSPPKGHVDPGEDDYTTALRETQEEAGYAAKDLLIHPEQRMELHYKVRGENKTVVYWLAQLLDAGLEPTLSDEHTAFKWLPAAEATELAGFVDFRKMLEHFEPIIPELIASSP